MSGQPELHLVAAVATDGCIGKGGALPWRLPEDLKHFKALTVGHAIIMGRKTFESIGRALPDRTSIVVTTRQEAAFPPDVLVAHSIDEALDKARAVDPSPRVVGGGDVYRATIGAATHLHITHVETEVVGGDAFFPPIDPDLFVEADRRPGSTPGVVFVEYRRA